MKFLGYPIEIWAASVIAVFIKLQTSSTLSFFGAVATTVVALFSGVFLHVPVATILGLDSNWHTVLAVIIALSAENLMKAVVEISADVEWLKDILRYFIDREKLDRAKGRTKDETVDNNTSE